MLIDNQGFLGVHLDGTLGPGFNPAHPIHSQTTGAHLSAAGVWTDASSREHKREVRELGVAEAQAALTGLQPVGYRSARDGGADEHLGFIAEDVPALVATADRTGLSPMDIVAVLTRVLQEQQNIMEGQQRRVEEQQRMVRDQQLLVSEQQKEIEGLHARVEELERTPRR